MKIGCYCGDTIIDQTDDLPHKGYLTPDQEWFATFDAIDAEIIDPVADGKLTKKAAYRLVRTLISRPARHMWQCRSCGRLYIEGLDEQLRCFIPGGEPVDREVLRSRPSDAAPGPAPPPSTE